MPDATAAPALTTDTIDLDAYFKRIGYHGPRTPTMATLCALTERHPAAIPFEAIDVLLGRPIELTLAAISSKLVSSGRGGYCFEHNSLFQAVLRQLGFHVEGLLARVLWNPQQQPAADAPVPLRTHMLLLVRLDGARWLVDVGFGACVPTSPLNLDVASPQRTPHDRLRIVHGVHEHRLEVQIDERWLPVYQFAETPQHDSDYVLGNWYTSTHPLSHFRRQLIVTRTTTEARWVLFESRLTRHDVDGTQHRERLDAGGIKAALLNVFGLPVTPDWHELIESAATRLPP